MKKWLIGVPLLLGVVLLLFAISIPETLKISQADLISCTMNGLSRQILEEKNWVKWLPGHREDQHPLQVDSSFGFKGYRLTITKRLLDGVDVSISKGDLHVESNLRLIPQSRESIKVAWQCMMVATSNPLQKMVHYQQARGVKNLMEDLLDALRSFAEKSSNIYGIEIYQVISQDSTLVGTKRTVASYPDVPEIYRLIDTLRQYIQTSQARQTDSPMLHVKKIAEGGYEIMVAVPVNKPLPERGDIFSNRFVPWRTLVGEVRGGFYSVDSAYKQVQLYIEDHQRTSMAIPFESLVTDRRKEKDTMKWVTKICQPVF